jgi:hypothetical protein
MTAETSAIKPVANINENIYEPTFPHIYGLIISILYFV